MGYTEEQMQNLTISVRDNFPKLNLSIKKASEDIEMMNLLKLVELNEQFKILSPKEEKDLLQKVKDHYLEKGKTYEKNRDRHFK